MSKRRVLTLMVSPVTSVAFLCLDTSSVALASTLGVGVCKTCSSLMSSPMAATTCARELSGKIQPLSCLHQCPCPIAMSFAFFS